MPDRIYARVHRHHREAEEEVKAKAVSGAELEDVDALLEEIDEVLADVLSVNNETAQEFMAAWVQMGGQ
jgi:Pup-like protein